MPSKEWYSRNEPKLVHHWRRITDSQIVHSHASVACVLAVFANSGTTDDQRAMCSMEAEWMVGELRVPEPIVCPREDIPSAADEWRMSSDSLSRSHCALLLACVHLLQVTSLTANVHFAPDSAYPFAKDDMSLWIDEAQVKQFFNGILLHFSLSLISWQSYSP